MGLITRRHRSPSADARGTAHDPSAVEVHDRCEVEAAVGAVELGDVRDPPLIGCCGGDVAFDEIGGQRSAVNIATAPDAAVALVKIAIEERR